MTWAYLESYMRRNKLGVRHIANIKRLVNTHYIRIKRYNQLQRALAKARQECVIRGRLLSVERSRLLLFGLKKTKDGELSKDKR